MGAWYVLATLGLYPISGSDGWIVGAPRWTKARVDVADHELVISTTGSGSHVHRVVLDGVALDAPQLTHAQLAAASTLVFEMIE